MSNTNEGLVKWVLANVRIDNNTKAIVVGKYYAIDGFDNKPIRVVTHIHSDHLIGLGKSVIASNYIIGTPLTLDMIEVLDYLSDESIDIFRAKKKPLNYGEKFYYNNSTLSLIENEHIFGSAQVLVEVDGYRVGYTGDIKLGGRTKIMKDLDVLIIESTYGSPSYVRPFKDIVEEVLVDLVRYGLRKYGRVIIYGYHGKLQEAMYILRRNGIEAPFTMPERVYKSTKVLEQYGVYIGNYYSHGEKIDSDQYIRFEHFHQARFRRIDGSSLNIILTGWEFKNPSRKVDEHTWVVALSDHADFDELISYVEIADPKMVVVDGSRNGEPFQLARELVRKGYPTLIMPLEVSRFASIS
ncbi:MBL fold metallo-hydrolase [Thermogladius sp. 4427co]|uniref:MBL fold metallo-hydrolase n=1 Tax=Thermogladius sp. 4427co TaxID=3450718 RepID=UPI003F7A52B6